MKIRDIEETNLDPNDSIKSEVAKEIGSNETKQKSINRTKKDRFDNNGEGNFSDKLINLLKDLFK